MVRLYKLLFCLVLWVNPTVAASPSASAASSPVIRALVEEDPPFSFWRDGRPHGIAVDLMEKIAKFTGHHVSYHRFNRNSDLEGLDLLKKEKFDVLVGGVTVDGVSFHRASFSRPYIISRLSAVRLLPSSDWLQTMWTILASMGPFFIFMAALCLLGLYVQYRKERHYEEYKNFSFFEKCFVICGEWVGMMLTGNMFEPRDKKNPALRSRCTFWSLYGAIFNTTFFGAAISLIALIAHPPENKATFSTASLRGRPVAFLRGETARAAIQRLGGWAVETNSMEEGLQLLKTKKIVAIVEQRAFLDYSLREQKFAEPVEYLTLQQNELAFATRDPQLTALMNHALIPLRTENIETICHKYFTADYGECTL